MSRKEEFKGAVICVIGLGYVGRPLAEAFARKVKVIGFDTDAEKIKQLNNRRKGRRQAAGKTGLTFTANPEEINKADYIILCVPTPINADKEPDLSFVVGAAEMAGRHMKKGSVAVLESTVYPGVTEEIVKPILERESGLKCGRGFKLGYSPERINPGDNEHAIEKVVKVVAGMDAETAARLTGLYRLATPRVFTAKNIRTAEAAKLVENTQRDLNIALMNEMAMLFQRMGLDIADILDTASTKWNFHRYFPGLVGGNCIPVVPYYLVHKAREIGYNTRLVLVGREVNESMPRHVVRLTRLALSDAGKFVRGARVLILGLSYKENVSDARESPVKTVAGELQGLGAEVYGYDPLVADIKGEFGINAVKSLEKMRGLDAVVVTVVQDEFREIKLAGLKKIMAARPVLVDLRQLFARDEAEKEGFIYQSF